MYTNLGKNICFGMALLCGALTSEHTIAQNFHAIQGSSYAGATSYFNNPASPINSLYKWDVNVFSVQVSNISNAFYFKGMKLPSIGNANLQLTEGKLSRYNHQSIDLNLFNAMYQIDKKQAISWGLRIRSYLHIKTSSFDINDTTDRLKVFLFNNRTTPFLEAKGTHAGWLEANLNYSRVLKETSEGKISAGVTLQFNKNVSGAYTKINRLTFIESKPTPVDTTYNFTSGAGTYAYSSNYDAISPYINLQGNINQMIQAGKLSLGLNLGIEYIKYNQSIAVDENEPIPYDWKIGVSIMDIGASTFKPSEFSSQFINPSNAITNGDLSKKFEVIGSSQDLRDSLATIFASIPVNKTFIINHPTRMIINADRNLGNHLFINGQLSLNFRSSSNFNKLNTRELSLLTITPRWETLVWGIYFPLQYNTQGQFWMGAAFKIGPLVAGIHSLGILKKDPLLNGGGYLMMSIHPFNKKMYTTRLDCF